MRIEFVKRDGGPQKLVSDVEIYFDADGPLQSLKLVGLTLWRNEKGLFVTFPARQFEGKDGKKFYDFLRAADIGDEGKRATYRLKDHIVALWCEKTGESPGGDEVPF